MITGLMSYASMGGWVGKGRDQLHHLQHPLWGAGGSLALPRPQPLALQVASSGLISTLWSSSSIGAPSLAPSSEANPLKSNVTPRLVTCARAGFEHPI